MTPAPGSAAEKMYAAQAGCTEGAECSDDDEDVPVADKTRSLDEFDSPLIRRKWKSFSSFAPTIKPETPPRGGLTKYAEVTQQAQETPTHLPSTRSEDGMRAKKVRKSISFAMDDEEAVFTSEVVKPPTLSPGSPPQKSNIPVGSLRDSEWAHGVGRDNDWLRINNEHVRRAKGGQIDSGGGAFKAARRSVALLDGVALLY